MSKIVTFENMSATKEIHLLIEWDTGWTKRDVIKSGEIVEINFGDSTAVICHRSDGGDYDACPNKLTIARAGDYFQLEEDGKYST